LRASVLPHIRANTTPPAAHTPPPHAFLTHLTRWFVPLRTRTRFTVPAARSVLHWLLRVYYRRIPTLHWRLHFLVTVRVTFTVTLPRCRSLRLRLRWIAVAVTRYVATLITFVYTTATRCVAVPFVTFGALLRCLRCLRCYVVDYVCVALLPFYVCSFSHTHGLHTTACSLVATATPHCLVYCSSSTCRIPGFLVLRLVPVPWFTPLVPHLPGYGYTPAVLVDCSCVTPLPFPDHTGLRFCHRTTHYPLRFTWLVTVYVPLPDGFHGLDSAARSRARLPVNAVTAVPRYVRFYARSFAKKKNVTVLNALRNDFFTRAPPTPYTCPACRAATARSRRRTPHTRHADRHRYACHRATAAYAARHYCCTRHLQQRHRARGHHTRCRRTYRAPAGRVTSTHTAPRGPAANAATFVTPFISRCYRAHASLSRATMPGTAGPPTFAAPALQQLPYAYCLRLPVAAYLPALLLHPHACNRVGAGAQHTMVFTFSAARCSA